jgi:hypothetical protein
MKRDIFFFLIIISILIGLRFITFKDDSSENMNILKVKNNKINKNISHKQEPLSNTHRIPEDFNEIKSQAQHDLKTLQNDLLEQKTQLAAYENKILSLKKHRQMLQNKLYYTDIKDIRDILGNLNAELNLYSTLQNQIITEADEKLKDQSSQAQVLKDQIDANIQTLVDSIRTTHEKLLFWQSYNSYMPEHWLNIEELQKNLSDQKEQLEKFKSQRILISSLVLEYARNLQNEKRQSIYELIQSQEDIQEEILNLNKDLYRIQDTQRIQNTNQQFLESELMQIQKSYDLCLEKIRHIEGLLKEKTNQQ